MQGTDHCTFEPGFYVNAFYGMAQPALVIDTGFTVRDANRAAVELLEYEDRETLVGTEVSNILVNSGILGEVAERIAVDDRWKGETKIATADGDIFTGTGIAVPIGTPDGTQLIAGLFSDRTEHHHYIRSIRVLSRVLRHNLRNDLNVVIGNLEQLRPAVGGGHEAIDDIYTIIDNLLKRADRARRLEDLIREHETHRLSPTRLDQHVGAAVDAARLQHDNATIVGPTDPDPVTVVGDDTITRMVTEVLENGVEHNHREQPTVRVSLSVAPDTATVSVRDDGPGLDPDRIGRMLGREEVGPLHHGTGMGLFFVDQIMDIYGGTVRVSAADDGGAEVQLSFQRVH